ncbi:MAG TPA: hypothetical protein VMI54_14160 [Polyangiaceae bacterium]|nr:hypothetical protein [Polyangiaceae bacterium]
MRSFKRFLVPLVVGIALSNCGGDDDTSNDVPSPGAGTSSGAGNGGTGASAGTGGSSGEAGAPPAAGTAGTSVEPTAGAGGEGGAALDDQGTCARLPGKIVYVESGDTQENLLKNLGRELRDTAGITLVFNLTGSCTLTNDIYTNTKVVPDGTLKYIPSSAEDPSWTPQMAEPTCTTPPDGVTLDLAISALFVESCGLGGPPDDSGLGLIQGPVQAYTFVVPTASDQTAIWAEEAYYAFGFGNANPLAPTYDPWNDEAFMFIRPATKSTLVATAKNIDVPPNKWKGVAEAASSDVVTAVSTSTEAEATIGILGAEVYDGNRNGGLQTLAFQAFGQNAAYYPDSDSAAFDKQNVRDGHYTLWSPTVYIAKVDDSNVPTDPTVRYVVDLVLGNTTTPPSGATPFDALADVVKVGLIPECAMQVTRSEDGGDLSPFAPAEPCTCYYLSQIPGASGTPDGCTACTDGSACGGGSCNHGFCEPNAISTAGTPSSSCFSGTPTTNADIVNACTTAQSIAKNVVLPSSELEPLP